MTPIFVLLWHYCKLKRKFYKLPLPCSLQIQHRATAGHMTRFRSPGRLCHTKRKQNWKLHAMIPTAILQCLRKVSLLVSKNKKVANTRTLLNRKKFVLQHTSKKGCPASKPLRIFTENLIIFKNFFWKHAFNRRFCNCMRVSRSTCVFTQFFTEFNRKPNTFERLFYENELNCEKLLTTKICEEFLFLSFFVFMIWKFILILKWLSLFTESKACLAFTEATPLVAYHKWGACFCSRFKLFVIWGRVRPTKNSHCLDLPTIAFNDVKFSLTG